MNADGTPNIAIFVPGVADDSHIFFNWADNATKANVLREKTAIMSYDIADPPPRRRPAVTPALWSSWSWRRTPRFRLSCRRPTNL